MGARILTAQFLAFVLASAGGFLPRNGSLFTSFDGYFWRVTTDEFTRFFNYIPGIPMMLFQGMGTPFMADPLLLPGDLPFALFGETPGAGLCYMASAGLMFLSTYAVGRALGFRRPPCLLAAWLLPFLSFTLPPWLTVYTQYNANPTTPDVVSGAMFAVALLARGYAGRRVIWASVGLVGVVLWLFLTQPLRIVLVLPTATALALGIMARYARAPDFLRKSALLLLPPLGFVALGGGAYLWGLFRNTAALFFADELGRGHGGYWDRSSILFEPALDFTPFHFDGPFHISNPVSALYLGCAVVGLILAIFSARRALRVSALSALAALAAFVLYIAIFANSKGLWILPVPQYFEFALWPLYALFASYAVTKLASVAIDMWPMLRVRALREAAYLKGAPLRLLILHVAGGALLGVLILDLRVPAGSTFLEVALTPYPWVPGEWPENYDSPPLETAITVDLAHAIGIAPGRPFRGYVVNLTGTREAGPGTVYWYNAVTRGLVAVKAFGNPHLMPFLWAHGIPTLEAYSELIEPAFYAVASRLLGRPTDGQTRNLAIVTRPDLPLLQSLGVRFIISDEMLPPPAKLTIALHAATMDQYLFELPDANFGSYSPTITLAARNATEAARWMADPSFDFRHTAILDHANSGDLMPAESSNATLTRGGWRVVAQSQGRSLLLIPLQYTHCLSVIEHQAKGGRIVAVERANLVDTALVFEGKIDVTLLPIISPFWNAFCNIADVREMMDFGLARMPRDVLLK